MNDDQINDLFDRWLDLTDGDRITVFSRIYGHMQSDAGQSKSRIRNRQANAFFELVEQYVGDCETTTDKEA